MAVQVSCGVGDRGAARDGGASKAGWAICRAQNFRLRNLIRLLDLSQTQNGAPPRSSNWEWTPKDPDEGRGTRGCGSRWG